jgi:hypothetical protein
MQHGEDRMSRWIRLVPVFAVSALLAACGGGGSDTPLAPASVAGPHYDGGLGMGGNATGPGPDSTTTTSTAQTDSTTLQGGGLGMGGN